MKILIIVLSFFFVGCNQLLYSREDKIPKSAVEEYVKINWSQNLSDIVSGLPDDLSNIPAGTVITLHLNIPSGYKLNRWTGACSGSTTSCTITLNSDINAGVLLDLISQYNVALSLPSLGGSINQSPAGLIFNEDTTISFNAIPDAGFVFKRWLYDCFGEPSSTCSITLNDSILVSAEFECETGKILVGSTCQLPTYTITINSDGINTISSNDLSTTSNSYVYTYSSGLSSKTFTATASSGYQFVRWNGFCEEELSNICVVNPGNSNITLGAEFELINTEPEDNSDPNSYFLASSYSLQFGNELSLWRTDGTPSGTYLIDQINPMIQSSYSFSLYKHSGPIKFKDKTYVQGTSESSSEQKLFSISLLGEIQSSDIRTASTQVVKINDKIYFLCYAKNENSPTPNTELLSVCNSNGDVSQVSYVPGKSHCVIGLGIDCFYGENGAPDNAASWQLNPNDYLETFNNKLAIVQNDGTRAFIWLYDPAISLSNSNPQKFELNRHYDENDPFGDNGISINFSATGIIAGSTNLYINVEEVWSDYNEYYDEENDSYEYELISTNQRNSVFQIEDTGSNTYNIGTVTSKDYDMNNPPYMTANLRHVIPGTNFLLFSDADGENEGAYLYDGTESSLIGYQARWVSNYTMFDNQVSNQSYMWQNGDLNLSVGDMVAGPEFYISIQYNIDNGGSTNVIAMNPAYPMDFRFVNFPTDGIGDPDQVMSVNNKLYMSSSWNMDNIIIASPGYAISEPNPEPEMEMHPIGNSFSERVVTLPIFPGINENDYSILVRIDKMFKQGNDLMFSVTRSENFTTKLELWKLDISNNTYSKVKDLNGPRENSSMGSLLNIAQ